jgi:hypothetical protein
MSKQEADGVFAGLKAGHTLVMGPPVEGECVFYGGNVDSDPLGEIIFGEREYQGAVDRNMTNGVQVDGPGSYAAVCAWARKDAAPDKWSAADDQPSAVCTTKFGAAAVYILNGAGYTVHGYVLLKNRYWRFALESFEYPPDKFGPQTEKVIRTIVARGA